jgi:hypothetical protein
MTGIGRGLIFVVLSWLMIVPALAQVPGGGGVNQSGAVTNGNCTKWLGTNTIADAGAPCGGSGSPGGTAGQVQYNASGSFGGFTVSGDGTLNTSTGALVVTKSNGAAFGTAAFVNTGTSGGTLGLLNTANTWSAAQSLSALTLSGITGSTQCLHVSTSGVVSGTGTDCGSGGSSGANPTATAGPTAINGTATTFMRSDAAPAVQQGSASQKGIVQVDGTTLVASSGVISASCTLTGPRTNTNTTDTIASSDCGSIVYENNAAGVAVSIPAATGSFGAGFVTTVCNVNAVADVITPASGTIGGNSTFSVPPGSASAPSCVGVVSTGSAYNVVPQGLVGGAIVPNVVGTVETISGTTYTFAATDCGKTKRFTSSSAVTATIPQGLPVGCVIAVEQAGTAKVSVNGSAVTPATLETHVASGAATGTGGQWAIINLLTESSNVAVLSGDAS